MNPSRRIETLIILTGGVIAIVIMAAIATGTTDDLPWGAIIIAVGLLAFGWLTARRRARQMAELDDEDRA